MRSRHGEKDANDGRAGAGGSVSHGIRPATSLDAATPIGRLRRCKMQSSLLVLFYLARLAELPYITLLVLDCVDAWWEGMLMIRDTPSCVGARLSR